MSLSRVASRRMTRAVLQQRAASSHLGHASAFTSPTLSLSAASPLPFTVHSRTLFSSSSSPSSGAYPSVVGRPVNYGVCIVPQTSAWVIERFGRFSRILPPGLHFLIPFVDRIAYIHSLKEQTIPISNQQAITMDNVTVRQLSSHAHTHTLTLTLSHSHTLSTEAHIPYFASHPLPPC